MTEQLLIEHKPMLMIEHKPAAKVIAAPRQTLSEYMEQKKRAKARRVKRNLPKEIIQLRKDMREAGIKFVNLNLRLLGARRWTGYYGYLVDTARRALKNVTL